LLELLTVEHPRVQRFAFLFLHPIKLHEQSLLELQILQLVCGLLLAGGCFFAEVKQQLPHRTARQSDILQLRQRLIDKLFDGRVVTVRVIQCAVVEMQFRGGVQVLQEEGWV
jgi:hypothetical protein